MSKAENNPRPTRRPMRNVPSASPPAQRATTDGPPVVRSRFSTSGEQRMHRTIVLAFAPLHKAAFGVAMGVVCGLALAIATVGDMWLDPQRRVGLGLLGEYFYGYTVSPIGIVVGFLWAAAVGFVGGWFMAFTRNTMMALWLLYFRVRADWKATGDFLDHI
jgi:hypothetical protein